MDTEKSFHDATNEITESSPAISYTDLPRCRLLDDPGRMFLATYVCAASSSALLSIAEVGVLDVAMLLVASRERRWRSLWEEAEEALAEPWGRLLLEVEELYP